MNIDALIDNLLLCFVFALIPTIFVVYHYIQCKLFEKTTYYQITGNSYWSTLHDDGKYGEYSIAQELSTFEMYGGKLLFNLYIPKQNGKTTEIDVVLITSVGILVVESKNYSGWIFGDECRTYWTQTLPSYRRVNKEKFYNPIKQNSYHIVHLRNLLKLTIPIYSIIVFSDHCEFKNVSVKTDRVKVIHKKQLKSTIYSLMKSAANCLSAEQIQNIYDKLFPFSQVDDSIKSQHVQDIKKNT